MSSDASHLGFGACYGSQWIQCPFPEEWKQLNITFLELYPIYVLVKMFGLKIRNSNILFYTDNEAAEEIINKQSSKDKTIMRIIPPLITSLVYNNINLKCPHVPGVENILPDHISRFKVTTQCDRTTWTWFQPQFHKIFCQKTSSFHVDGFTKFFDAKHTFTLSYSLEQVCKLQSG